MPPTESESVLQLIAITKDVLNAEPDSRRKEVLHAQRREREEDGRGRERMVDIVMREGWAQE